MRFLMVFAVTLAACFGASLCGGWVVFELAAKLWPVIVFFSLVISVPVTLLLRQSERIDLLEERIEVLGTPQFGYVCGETVNSSQYLQILPLDFSAFRAYNKVRKGPVFPFFRRCFRWSLTKLNDMRAVS